MRKSLLAYLLLTAFVFTTNQAEAGCWSFLEKIVGLGRKPKAVELSPSETTTQVTRDHDLLRKAKDRNLSAKERQELIEAYAKPLPNPAWQRATVYANWAFAGIIGAEVLQKVAENPKLALPAVLLAPVALWVADLGGQIFHKWLDSYASERNPIWGSTAQAFRKHHEVPNNLDKEPYVSNVTPASVMLAPFLGATAMANLSPEAATPIAIFLMSIMHTTEFHKQAHLKNPNPLFKFLQKVGLSLSHDVHMTHHRPPFDSEFSVFLGWSNGFARKTDLWNRMDRVFWKFTGRMPHNWIQDPRSIPEPIVNEIVANLEKLEAEKLNKGIPAITPDDIQDLDTYTKTYSTRTSEKVLEMIQKARVRWQADFLSKRRAIFQEMAVKDPDKAVAEWIKEQEEFPWLYGETIHPLVDSN